MVRMGIRELRDTLPAAIRRVRGGETIEVTHDGVPVALITPVPESKLDRLIAAGEVTLPTASLFPLPTPGRQTGPMSASEALEDDRGK
jgi:antitoxin (DNA-binding transcriptional repressor) of toxin-antitoxin stability system